LEGSLYDHIYLQAALAFPADSSMVGLQSQMVNNAIWISDYATSNGRKIMEQQIRNTGFLYSGSTALNGKVE
jgi:hypothetical protein